MLKPKKNTLLKPKKPKKKHQFNLRAIEDSAIKALDNFYAEDTEESRTQLYLAIKELAFTILCVGSFNKYKIDYKEVSYEYAVYLFERIILGTFNPYKSDKYRDRFPFQDYVSRNILHIVLTKRNEGPWQEVLTDFEFLVDQEEGSDLLIDKSESLDEKLNHGELSYKLYRSMRMFYSDSEIRRMVPLATEIIFSNGKIVVEKFPKDMQDFVATLIAVSKRIVTDCNFNKGLFDVNTENFKKARLASVRSTLFLSSIVNTEFFPKELLLSLDIDSLYRLVYTLGGKTIKIPTQSELNTLLGAVVTASKVILEDKELAVGVKNAKADYDLVFTRHINIKNFVSKILESYDLFKEDKHSEPLINTLLLSINTMNKLLKDLQGTKLSDPRMLIQQYKDVTETFSSLSTGLMTIQEKIKNAAKSSELE